MKQRSFKPKVYTPSSIVDKPCSASCSPDKRFLGADGRPYIAYCTLEKGHDPSNIHEDIVIGEWDSDLIETVPGPH